MTHSFKKIAPSGYTFTPLGEEEPHKVCKGDCRRFLASKFYNFHYKIQDNIRGKFRDEICKRCYRYILDNKIIENSSEIEELKQTINNLTSEIEELKRIRDPIYVQRGIPYI